MNLTGSQIKDTYEGVLNIGATGLTGALQEITDGLGNLLNIQVSDTTINFSGIVTGNIIGTTGAAGTSGTSGTSGINGTSGTSGTSGVSGSSGTSGINGTSGTSGTSGVSGSSGTSGTSGINGATGPAGPTGADGSSGVAGSTGATGPAGATGAGASSPITIEQTNSLVSTAIGGTATVSNAIVIGATACATTQNSIAIGTNATACPAGGFGIAIGLNAKVDGNNNGIAIGDGCSSQGQAINIGFSNGLAYNNHIQVGNNNSVPIGGDIFVFGSNNGGGGGSPAAALALGSGNQVGGFGGVKIAVGFNNVNSANCTMALGLANTICSSNAFTNAIGFCNTIHTGATGTIVLGCSSVGGTGACNSVVLGNSACTIGSNSIAIGCNTRTICSTGIAIGKDAIAREYGVVIGEGACNTANAYGNGSVAIGLGAIADDLSGISIGPNSVSGQQAVAIGTNANGDYLGIAIGTNGKVCSGGPFRISIGFNTCNCGISSFSAPTDAGPLVLGNASSIGSSSARSIVVGSVSSVTSNDGLVFGHCSTSGVTGGVVIGNNLTAIKQNTTHVNSLVAFGQGASLTNANGDVGGTVTLDWDNGNNQSLTLTSSISSLTLSNPIDGANYGLFITQGGAGGYTITWPASVKWPNATPPVITGAIGSVTTVSLIYIGTVYYGSFATNLA
jgi:hypothetical protein